VKTTLRRGFKAEANARAKEIRAELGLNATDKVDVWQLAALLEIPIVPLTELRSVVPDAVHQFTVVDQSAFSAATVFCGSKRIILYNDVHAKVRQASDIAHEISHALLGHDPQPALDELGCRQWDAECELEADWLAGVLLVPEEATLASARAGLSDSEAARRYGVSLPMMQFRMNMTAARRRVTARPR
jgi:Zn-dependent peptidase ImmA (M78 family)